MALLNTIQNYLKEQLLDRYYMHSSGNNIYINFGGVIHGSTTKYIELSILDDTTISIRRIRWETSKLTAYPIQSYNLTDPNSLDEIIKNIQEYL